MPKKYVLTTQTLSTSSITVLYQIQALIGIPNVCKKGDLGGWIQSEKNLSQKNFCWVSGNAQVSGNAYVSGNAWVYGKAHVFGYAQVSGNAQVWGDAHVWGNAQVYGNAHVYGNAQVWGEAHVYVPIDFNCDFDPWNELNEILKVKENLPRLLGLSNNFDKIIEQKLKAH